MEYYYLVAGLPDLHLDMDTRLLDYPEIYDTIERNLTPTDLKPYEYLLYQNDNSNLIGVLFEEAKGRPLAPFRVASGFSQDELRDHRRERSRFPAYMNQFLEVYADQINELSSSTLSDRLDHLFMEEVETVNDDFLTSYLQFDRLLKDILATYNAAAFPLLGKPSVQSSASLLRQIGPNKAASPKLLKSIPYLEALLESLTTGDPQDIEGKVDRIIWEYVSSFNGFFGSHQVYAYALQLMIVQRRTVLRQGSGKERLQELIANIKKISREPKTVQL